MKNNGAESWDVAVVGGGAAGMMAALTAAERGKKVLLIEKNATLGVKLSISGGGRCNITNAEFDTKKFLAHYGDAAKFLASPNAQFGVKDTFTYFEQRGLPLVVQARQRAFPHTERATDVVALFERELKRAGVTVELGKGIKSFADIPAKAIILATGGVSHPKTGSTGDGWKMLRVHGHTTVSPTPTIVPIIVADQWITSMKGVSLKDVSIAFYFGGKKQFSVTGSLLCTHFGLSGPTILNVASRVAGLLEAGDVEARIDCYPHLDLGALDAHVQKIFDQNKNKTFKTVLKDIAPVGAHRGIAALIRHEMLEQKVHSISREDRKTFVKQLKSLPVTVTGLMGFDRAVVADGGVPLTEIDTRTFESKLVPNLYIIGDLLHVNRPSGGYSLQLAWMSGYVAGSAV